MKSQNVIFGVAVTVLIIATSFGQRGGAQVDQEPGQPPLAPNRVRNSTELSRIVENLQVRVERLEARAALGDSSIIESRSDGRAGLGLEQGTRAMQLLSFESDSVENPKSANNHPREADNKINGKPSVDILAKFLSISFSFYLPVYS